MDSQQSQIPADMRAYLENLLEDSNINLTPELKENMLYDLYLRLEKKLIADAIENMEPADVEQFTQLIQSQNNKEAIDEFIKSHLPNAQEIFTQSLVDFKTDFIVGATQQSTPAENPPVVNNNPAEV